MKNARILGFLLLAAAVWLPSLHLFYRPSPGDRSAIAGALAERQMEQGADGVARMRTVNPEWDFMTRTYTVLALANRAAAVPTRPHDGQPSRTDERARLLATIDQIIDATIAEAKRHGDAYFLLPYAKDRPFVDPEAKSLFVDGEIVMMIGARELVEPKPRLRADAMVRAERIARAMAKSPTLSGESYPDECWTFCNTTALAGLAMLDRAAGTDHGDLARAWVAHAKQHLVEPRTGLLVSRYTYDGKTLDGPEGSSLWMSAHNLLFVDPDFARDQYTRARRQIGASLLGFGWAREWPEAAPGRPDVDSGPTIPILGASAGSSGLALLGAAAFGDDAWLGELLASLELAGFRDPATGRYRASNDVGDAVLLYALSYGPLAPRMSAPAPVARVHSPVQVER